MASVRNSKQHLRGRYPAGHDPDLSPTRGRRAARGARPGRAELPARGRRAAVAVTSGWDLLTGVSAGARAAGERRIDSALVCEDGLASPAPGKRGPTLTRY